MRREGFLLVWAAAALAIVMTWRGRFPLSVRGGKAGGGKGNFP